MPRSLPSLVASLAALLLSLVCDRASAQRTVSLGEALSIARAHNRDLHAARARLEQSATAIDQAWVALLPQVYAQGKYTHNYREVSLDLAGQLSKSTLGLAEVLRSTSTDPAQQAALTQFQQLLSSASATPAVLQKGEQLNASVNATIPLIVPYAWLALTSARRAHGANEAAFLVTEATVLLAVAQCYFAAAGAEELLTVRQSAVRVAQETLDNARVRVDAGSASEVDRIRAELAVVKRAQAAAEAEDARDRVVRALGTMLGVREPLRVTADDRVPDPGGDALSPGRALQRRPESLQLTQAIRAADASVDASAIRWAPTLSAFGNAQAFNYRGFSGDRYAWAVGLQLDWAVYDGGARDAARRHAAAQRHEHEARLSLLRDTVADELDNARSAVTTKSRALQAATRAAELAVESLRLVRAQYSAGRATQLDLLQAQDASLAAQVDVAQARFALSLARLELNRSAGLFPGRR